MAMIDPAGGLMQTLTLNLLVGVEPPSGEVCGEGLRLPFEGWIGLVSALERARQMAGGPGEAPPPDSTSGLDPWQGTT